MGFVYFCQGGEPVALVAVDEGAEDVGHRSASIGDLYEDHSSVGWVWTALGFAELMDGFKDGFAKDATGDVQALTGHPARSVGEFARDFASYFGPGA